MSERIRKKKKHPILFALLGAVLLVILIAVGYIAYVLIDYHRVEDNLPLEVKGQTEVSSAVPVGEELDLISYNIGFAAYTPDFGFFMDGGTESRAHSKESVEKTMAGILAFLKDKDADFLLLEEVDKKATRSYYVDEAAFFSDSFPTYQSVFAVNYDSPYLFYPFNRPHGKSLSGLLTFSRYPIKSSIRESLPIETSLMKLIDLDRCYSVTRIPTANEKELVIFTTHLSAYTSDGKIADEQLSEILSAMQSEYEKGNYAVCGGDFNKDLLGNSGDIFGVSTDGYTWAQPIRKDLFDGKNLTLIAPFHEDHPVASCRNADAPVNNNQLRLTVDGFIISDNITLLDADVLNTSFLFSDHNPVGMSILLKP